MLADSHSLGFFLFLKKNEFVGKYLCVEEIFSYSILVSIYYKSFLCMANFTNFEPEIRPKNANIATFRSSKE